MYSLQQKGNKNVYNDFKWRFNWGNKTKETRKYRRSTWIDNVDGKAKNIVEELVIDFEADKFLVLFEKIFNKKHIEQGNIIQDLDAEDGAIQDILIKIANKISEKIENSTGENKTLKLLKLIKKSWR